MLKKWLDVFKVDLSLHSMTVLNWFHFGAEAVQESFHEAFAQHSAYVVMFISKHTSKKRGRVTKDDPL